jgi:hypothetical protein
MKEKLMGKTLIIVLFTSLLILASCSKTETADIKLLFTIDGSFEPQTVAEYDRKFTVISDIEVDKDGNIFLFNPRLERILKFTKDGEFIKYFGARGSYKGEMMNALDFTILNDTIYIKNNYFPLIIRYSLEGNFIDDFKYEQEKFQSGEVIRSVSNDKIVGYISSTEHQENEIVLKNKLALMDKKFEKLAVLREYSAKFDRNDPKFFELITKYAVGEGKIYVAENEDDQYRISIYDYEGNKSGEIKKDYKKTEYNTSEMEVIRAMPLSMKVDKDERDTLETRTQYKRSINAVYFDKYKRLLVCPSIKRNENNQNDFIADVFEGEKYTKTIKIPQLKGEDFLYRFESEIFFIGDRIYEVLHKEMKVNVYAY